VSDSQQAHLTEKALWERLGRLRLSYFTIGREGGSYDVMGDSGTSALNEGDLQDARAAAAQFNNVG
jgi:hypothetical protein